ncbi:MAG TPA: FtsX-like permease family protein [Chryseolinea sp.]|nr:FtsX-like permease family protein [Chryseolinea sp.]
MKSAWRNLLKNKTYMIINLFGLTLGLSVSIFILLFVRDEFNYDKFLPGFERTFRIQFMVTTDTDKEEWATTEGFVIPTMTPQYPEIEAATRILKTDQEIVLKTETEKIAQDGFLAVDSTFFRVFPFEFIYGDRRTALNTSDGIVVTRSVAKKFFGDIDPIGKILTADFGDLIVKGVIEDVPKSSHFHFNVAFPLKAWWRGIDGARGAFAVYSYIRLNGSTSPAEFQAKHLKDWYNHYGYLNDSGNPTDASGPPVTLLAKPIHEIHLQSHAEKEFEANGQLQVVYIFIGVGIFLIVLATINYVNLSNAVAIKRAKEVAIRKTIGASQQKLFVNFICESYAFTLFAFVFAIAAVIILLPKFNTFTGKQLELKLFLEPQFALILFLGWLALGFFSGLYPATILSSFDPVQALKSGGSGKGMSKFSIYFRKGLIVSQFTISAFMVVGALTIQRQLNFIDSRNVGFNKNNVIVLPLAGDARSKLDVLKNEISRVPGVESCAATSVVPGKRVMFLGVRVPSLAGTVAEDGSTDGSRPMRVIGADADFVKSLGLEVAEGRNFEANSVADSAGGFILNEAAVREFKLKDPVGSAFEYTYAEHPKIGKVIGVVKDFNFASVHAPVEPVMIHIYPMIYTTLCVRVTGDNLAGTIDKLGKAWEGVTTFPFSYQFLDSSYDAIYKTERATGQIITSFTLLALVIAGLGLFGIVSFFVSQRTKEVGVRKVFGASHYSLVKILSREYVMMAIIGNVVAIYPAYFIVNQWLRQFAYHIDLSFTSFVVAFLLCELFAFVSIIFVILRTVRVNPSTILRQE